MSKLTYYAAILTSEGQRVEFSCPANPAGFIRQLKEMGIRILGVAYESGPTDYELAWQCQEASLPILVAAASKIPRPIVAGGKTDRLDGRKLAEYLANRYIRERYLPAFKAEFSQPAQEEGSAFVSYPGRELDDVLCEHHERVPLSFFSRAGRGTAKI